MSRTTILGLKQRLEILQRRNTMLIRRAQKEGLPIPILRASNPLPNRRLVVIPSNPSYHQYGPTFDSIVPASPPNPSQTEQQVIEVTTPKPGSSGSTAMENSEASISTVKVQRKGFKLNIFKGVFGKGGKKQKSRDPIPSTSSIPITISPSDQCPVLKPPTHNCAIEPPLRLPRFQPSRSRSEGFKFSMQPVYTSFDSNKGIKERPTPSARAIEKFINAGPVSLPRYARDLIRSQPPLQFHLEPSENARWRYAGRALAEWELIVKQCDSYVDSILRKRESIPEEEGEEQGEQESLFVGAVGGTPASPASSIPSSPTVMSCAPRHVIENIHIPRMTVEPPKFYFTGKSNREG